MDASQRAALRMVLDDLIRERDNLSVTIGTLNARLALYTVEEASSPTPNGSQLTISPARLPDDAIISPGELLGLTSTAAAGVVLRKAQRPLTTQDLLRLLRRGGLTLNGVHAANTLRRALDNSKLFYYARPRHWAVRQEDPGPEVRPSS